MAHNNKIKVGEVVTRENNDTYKVTIEIDELKRNPFPDHVGNVIIELPLEYKDLVKKLETQIKTTITKYGRG